MMILLPPNSERESIIRSDDSISSWNGYSLKEFNQDDQIQIEHILLPVFTVLELNNQPWAISPVLTMKWKLLIS